MSRMNSDELRTVASALRSFQGYVQTLSDALQHYDITEPAKELEALCSLEVAYGAVEEACTIIEACVPDTEGVCQA
ncbi:MAG: hypothetical protein Q4G00_03785 [Clostridia bacterium]|nr:hypothetical protein [Clostridia bacterium]